MLHCGENINIVLCRDRRGRGIEFQPHAIGRSVILCDIDYGSIRSNRTGGHRCSLSRHPKELVSIDGVTMPRYNLIIGKTGIPVIQGIRILTVIDSDRDLVLIIINTLCSGVKGHPCVPRIIGIQFHCFHGPELIHLYCLYLTLINIIYIFVAPGYYLSGILILQCNYHMIGFLIFWTGNIGWHCKSRL